MRKRFKIDIYHTFFTVIYIDDLVNLYEDYPVLKDKIDLSEYGAVTFQDIGKSGCREFYIGISKNDCSFGLISHEIVHLVNYIFKYRGVYADLENDEPQAYLTQLITSKITKFIYGKK